MSVYKIINIALLLNARTCSIYMTRVKLLVQTPWHTRVMDLSGKNIIFSLWFESRIQITLYFVSQK